MVQFFSRCCLIEAAHGEQMVHLHAAWSDVGTDTAQLWMVRVELLEFVPKPVKFCVADLGLCKVVVEVGVVGNLLRQ